MDYSNINNIEKVLPPFPAGKKNINEFILKKDNIGFID
jgi:hypothetical protein